MGVVGFIALAMACAPVELAWRENPEKEPGNFGDPFGVKMYNEEMRTKELSNGRMAMISVLGIFAAELATGKDAIEQFGLSALPAGALSGSSSSRSSSSKFTGSTLMGKKALHGRTSAAVATVDEVAPPP